MAYNKGQRLAALEAWYASGAGALKPFADNYVDARSGKKLALQTVQRWHQEDEWKVKAARWDKEAAKASERKMIDERKKMRERQVNVGKLLQAKALKTLQKDDFEFKTEYGILSALQAGTRMETEALASEEEFARRVHGMSDEDLETFVAEQQAILDKGDDEGFDAGVVPQLKAPEAKRIAKPQTEMYDASVASTPD